jgi:hypothetical protein
MISRLASLATEIKGHHFYNYKYKIDEQFRCEQDATNAHSENAILVKSIGGSKIGHLPEALAKKLAPLLKNGKISEIDGTITSGAQSSKMGTWKKGGGIELPCKVNIHGLKENKSIVIKKLKE